MRAGVCVLGCTRASHLGWSPVTLRVGVGVPEKDTQGSGLRALIDLLTTESLVSNALDGRQTERLARSWSWDESAVQSWPVTLRQDVLFHDGTRLTPELAANALRTSIEKRDAEVLRVSPR